MKTHLAYLTVIALVWPLHAAATGSPKPGTNTQSSPPPQAAKGKSGQQATTATTSTGQIMPSAGATSTPATAAAPAQATAPAPQSSMGNVTLNAYIQALTDTASLTKDEQKDIKTYYLDDGATLNDILNSATLTPFEQMEHVEDLRNLRNAKIEALLRDVDRQDAFLKTEAMYRVALTELAATGGLAPTTPPPTVPEPTATPPGQAEKAPKPQSAP